MSSKCFDFQTLAKSTKLNILDVDLENVSTKTSQSLTLPIATIKPSAISKYLYYLFRRKLTTCYYKLVGIKILKR